MARAIADEVGEEAEAEEEAGVEEEEVEAAVGLGGAVLVRRFQGTMKSSSATTTNSV